MAETSLFESHAPRPLADKLRPKTLSEVVGQDHLLAPQGAIGRMVAAHRLASMVLWGPPGCGKTTIARLLAEATSMHFEAISAVFSGVADLRKVFDAAKKRRVGGQGTLLFVDEIHRFNRAQQDGFLPYVEDGIVVLVGATTENPSFELNGALLSRAQVFVLHRLDEAALDTLLERAEAALGRKLPLDDKAQEGHYNLISALHKAVRGSDVDAALYWLARMLAGGEHPEYIARRVLRMAIEDIGLADPQGLVQALAAWQAYERLGSPEGELAIAQAVIYLATAPKSVAAYMALGEAQRAAKESGSLMPPMHSVNAPTKLMKELGYGKGYVYDPDTEEGFSGQSYFPDELPRQAFYRPIDRGFEREIKKRLDYWEKLRNRS